MHLPKLLITTLAALLISLPGGVQAEAQHKPLRQSQSADRGRGGHNQQRRQNREIRSSRRQERRSNELRGRSSSSAQQQRSAETQRAQREPRSSNRRTERLRGDRSARREGNRDGRQGEGRRQPSQDNRRGDQRQTRPVNNHHQAGRDGHRRDNRRDQRVHSDRSRRLRGEHARRVAPPARGHGPGRGHQRDNRRQRRNRQYPHYGHHIQHLPRNHYAFHHNHHRYHFYHGIFYRPFGSGFTVVAGPIGARIRVLPDGYFRFRLRNRTYFYLNHTYYRWYDDYNSYVVVAEPAGAAEIVEDYADDYAAYPDEEQAELQVRLDRFECHEWAAENAGFNPTLPNQPESRREDYRRAMDACLDGRGYRVR